jgi:Uma2 family endonuclease
LALEPPSPPRTHLRLLYRIPVTEWSHSIARRRWISQSRWDALTPTQRQKWVPLCPDFLVELKSTTDDIEDLRLKMQEYVENGLPLGWLIDPETQIVEIYQADGTVETLNSPSSLDATPIVPGFVLNLTGILTDQ